MSNPLDDGVTYLDDHRDRWDAARRLELARRLADGDTRRLRDDHLGAPLPNQLIEHHEALRAAVHAQIRHGATVHRRLPLAIRLVPPAVALLDGLVLFTFCAAIFNVDLQAPWTVQGAVAAMLALLGTGIAYTWLALTGLRLRGFRTELGEIDWKVIGRSTTGALAVAGVVILTLAVLMYLRVVTDAGMAAAAGYLPASAVTVLALVFAVISGAANLAVIAVHALDGSEAARELRHAGRLLLRHERSRERARRRAFRRPCPRDAGVEQGRTETAE